MHASDGIGTIHLSEGKAIHGTEVLTIHGVKCPHNPWVAFTSNHGLHCLEAKLSFLRTFCPVVVTMSADRWYISSNRNMLSKHTFYEGARIVRGASARARLHSPRSGLSRPQRLHVSTTAPHDANSDVSSKEGAVIVSTRNTDIYWSNMGFSVY
jgi:hypothetical protein